ncbi:MAG: hypothetical protein ACRDDH_11835 [Cetobacterium sp.]|uniref:hypothetical protein n=1 Tax=Cetobacterium sp. TaxID=2071632 RepID=UPI003EE76043
MRISISDKPYEIKLKPNGVAVSSDFILGLLMGAQKAMYKIGAYLDYDDDTYDEKVRELIENALPSDYYLTEFCEEEIVVEF